MKEQFCVRTYEKEPTDSCDKSNYEELNKYLNRGWKVVMVTPKPGYNEYIIEREEYITLELWMEGCNGDTKARL